MTASGARSRSGPTPLALAVVALVLGILGMHGLGGHGVASALASPAAATGSVAAAAVHEVHEVHDASGSHTGRTGDAGHGGPRPAPADEEHGHQDGSGDMVMWCVALLAGAAAALVVALVARTRPTRPWAVLAPAPTTWLPRPLLLRVGTGPPHVWSFSVIRC